MVKSYKDINSEERAREKEERHDRKHRKFYAIGIFALLITFMAFALAENAQQTAEINNIFEIVVNNTDLYPAQRTNHTVYWANDSPIAVYVVFHALGSGAAQAFDSNFTINGSVVLDRDIRTSAGPGFHDHWSFYTIVPKGANYSIQNSSNVFSIEWREYPVLSGKNGTLSINQSFVGSSFNTTYDAYGSSKVNKSGDTSTGQQNFTDGFGVNILELRTIHNSNVVEVASNSTNATNIRIRASNNSAHIGLMVGNQSNASTVTIEIDSNNDGLVDIRGKNQQNGTDAFENTKLIMNASGFTIKSDKGNITLDPKAGFVNFSGSAIRNTSQLLIGTNENNLPASATTFRNMRIMNNNLTALGFAEFVSFNASPRALFLFRTAKGNDTAPLAVTNGDFTGEILGGGWTGIGGDFANNGAINFKVDTGTISSTSLPGIITFETSPSGSTSRAERMSINNTGHVKMNTYSGTGEGFVCFDSTGVIFRKETACATDG